MKRLAALAMLCALAALPVQAQTVSLEKGCLVGVSSIDIKTGVDETTNGVLPIGVADQSWTVLSDPDSGTSEPRPATTIPPYLPYWAAPLPGTTYISSYATSTNDRNGLYQFETCFCLRPDFKSPKLTLSFLADDLGEAFLNGNSMGKTTGTPYNFSTPTTLTTANPAWFKPGRNCLRVDVTNTGSVAMGFDLSATVQTQGPGLDRPACCNRTGSLSGRKWNDLNGDGVMQSGEPVLPGWLIKLSNGTFAVTDVNGYYYFVNLPVGSYTISEQMQPGWQQTFPLTGTHTVTVTAGQAQSNLDFGNRPCPRCTEGQIVFVPAGSPDYANLCARLCCKKGEHFFQNSCGCGCSEKPACPDIGTPGITWVSRDPAFCARAKFFCKKNEQAFSNECGCGCRVLGVSPADPVEPANPQ
jgi:hypothetical protein